MVFFQRDPYNIVDSASYLSLDLDHDSKTRPVPYRSARTSCRFKAKYYLALLGMVTVAGLLLVPTDNISETSPKKLVNSFLQDHNFKNTFCGSTSGSSLSPSVIKTPPTSRFRDALLPKNKYITSFVNSGWTNDVMAVMTLIRLAQLSRRIPILPPFTPSHAGHDAGFAPFSFFFDIDALSETLRMPIIEWKDIKNVTDPKFKEENKVNGDYYGGEFESLGCWSVWMTQMDGTHPGRAGYVPDALTLDISWTPAPPEGKGGNNYNLFTLAEMSWPDGRSRLLEAVSHENWMAWLRSNNESRNEDQRINYHPFEDLPSLNKQNQTLEPDDHLLCFDYLYYTQTYGRLNWADEGSDYWHSVGRYVKWSKEITTLATAHLLKAFGFPPNSKLPMFIAVHIRRMDFLGWCYGAPQDECLAPLSAYARRVQEVRDEMQASFDDTASGQSVNFNSIPVIIMSDEPHTTNGWTEDSEGWWAEVEKLGWKYIDHDVEQTVEKYGMWYPPTLDAAMLSLGSGFVGTERSTYSLISAKRVKDWAGGPTRLVRWGHVGADDH